MTATPIPPELLENVAAGRCVLFLGADDRYQTTGWPGLPTRRQLADALAANYSWVRPHQTLPQAAADYFSKRPHDRHGLIRFLREQLDATRQPGPIHDLLLELGFDAIVTNGYDDLLFQAFKTQRRVLQVIGDVETAYAGGKEEAILIHLVGVINQPDSLVLTKKDQRLVTINLSKKLEAVRGWCSLRPLLFIGWDPEDELLGHIYTAATAALREHKQRNYLVWPDPTPQIVAEWAQENVAIIDAQPLLFLQALQQAVVREQRLKGVTRRGKEMLVGKLPYKYLNYYDPEDADIFYGREVEAPLVYRKTLNHSLLVLFGQSGVGKTSLLRAGVVPLLLADGYEFVYARALGDPLAAIRQAVLAARQQTRMPELTGGPEALRQFLTGVLGADGKLVIMLDQFEELFTGSLSRQTQNQFWQQVGACQEMAAPKVHFILSLREDYLPHLAEASRPPADGQPAPLPHILYNSYRLNRLDAHTAYLAVVEPARRARCTVDPRLARVLVGEEPMPDVSDPAAWSLLDEGQVPPPALQIVMDGLYRAALHAAGHKLPEGVLPPTGWQPPALTLSLDLYRAQGGAARLLADYVGQALHRLPQQGGDAALAQSLLKVMVTSQKTKAAQTWAEMVQGMAESGAGFDPQQDQPALQKTRDALVNARLLRSFRVGEQTYFELAHDHMAAEIGGWLSKEELQTRLARELLRREWEKWQSHTLLIAADALALIHEQRAALRPRPEELELLFRSALVAGYEAVYWFARAQAAGLDVSQIARAGLASESYQSRKAAVQALAGLGERFAGDLIEMLADPYPQVRVAAIHALEQLRPDLGWHRHLKYDCYVAAGPFIMGDDNSREKDEKPAHEVYLDAYYIGKYPVTNAEYQRYMDDIGRVWQLPKGKEQHPVVNMRWYDAQDYAVWAGMRLLTEAQWEKAATWEVTEGEGEKAAGRKRPYPWGDRFDKTRCNTEESGRRGTTPVGQYSPQGDSPHGVADMAGNVWEWTSTRKKAYPYDAPDGREDPPSGYDSRVMRGGSYYSDAASARGGSRRGSLTGYGLDSLGFRCGVVSRPFSPPPAGR
ncbi:MAG: SUMF1/EgtB/PvdO family nonheme iron enzyme [Anaerolineales bacterium]|nr:SUMF1/EgtB/PvdO family nonheme iron enzyme [Anaerolineales bacterium]MCB0010251.1 SUMF1/EgtB/PvdO family nonheme iron enzyme [Anaerolineales bacterium]